MTRSKWLITFLLAAVAAGWPAANCTAAYVKFTAEVPNGSLNFPSTVNWTVGNPDEPGLAFQTDLSQGQNGNNVVSSMLSDLNSFANQFSGDGSVSGKTLTVDTATNGDFSAVGEVGMSMEANPMTSCMPGCVPPNLPLNYKPFGKPGRLGYLILLISDPDGLPTLAGGNGSLVVSVDVDGSSAPVVATASFSAADSTSDLLNVLDSVFSSASLSPGARYEGILNGAPVFTTDDMRPLSVGISTTTTDELSFVTAAAIYYIPEPATAVLIVLGLAIGASAWRRGA